MLYVGKAKNLNKRISNYLRINQLAIDKQELVSLATKIKFQKLGSEIEAILTEAELIRVYQPKFNILLKDDKSPLCIEITPELFPRVLPVRQQHLSHDQKSGLIFGPFHSAFMVGQLLKISRKIFPWCNQSRLTNQNKPCFYYHLDLCPGACCGKISTQDYQKNIQKLAIFLRGHSDKLLRQLKTEMQKSAQKEQFELAAQLKKQIEAIVYVTKESFRLEPNWQGIDLSTDAGQNRLKYLGRLLKLNLGLPAEYPLQRIEGYDVSNLQGQAATVSMVTFINGQETNSEHRLFNIKSINQSNDFGMLQEALIRRQHHPEWGTPNLLVIDGGKGQVRAVLKIWQWATPVIGIEKNPDRLVLPIISKDQQKKNKISWQVIRLDASHPGLKLVQSIRDVAHRFGQRQHRRLLTKNMLY